MASSGNWHFIQDFVVPCAHLYGSMVLNSCPPSDTQPQGRGSSDMDKKPLFKPSATKSSAQFCMWNKCARNVHYDNLRLHHMVMCCDMCHPIASCHSTKLINFRWLSWRLCLVCACHPGGRHESLLLVSSSYDWSSQGPIFQHHHRCNILFRGIGHMMFLFLSATHSRGSAMNWVVKKLVN